ncbi:GntR family transcriptional regulator [Youxingia wuxianensis]|uniref:GntR family transcriptional regulator n=1 Tax=Youxingia wuxianensis TaxID=2763678 RepID=A0A926IHB9_9FIRM|nr:GntR family transcriptional regulator [Youxingia wuxianensis]MBC8584548.1 GntR family transcriptional regulator [Youxingia wuxianensis]
MLQLDLQSRTPIYEQLITKMSEMISLGVLSSGEQLPSVRALARDLGVNPNTVQKAYQELERNGIIYSVSGKGSFIASGNSANEILKKQTVSKITEAVTEGKRTGLTKPQVIGVVELVYKEG